MVTCIFQPLQARHTTDVQSVSFGLDTALSRRCERLPMLWRETQRLSTQLRVMRDKWAHI